MISWWEAADACVWQIAKEYVEYDGKIRPSHEANHEAESGKIPKYWQPAALVLTNQEADLWKTVNYWPLADSNLFRSFSRLGARGDELPGAAILRWVHKHGLLQLKNPNEGRLSLDNQMPISLKDFREEASQAYRALTLFKAIHAEDYDALRPRINQATLDRSGQLGASSNSYVHVDGQPIPLMFTAGEELSDEMVRTAAERGLEWLVTSRFEGVNLGFDVESGHSRPREVYRPKLVINVPDLWHAIWYQFALLMTDARPVKFCEICEDPIFHPRRDHKTCSDACRQEKYRRKQARERSV